MALLELKEVTVRFGGILAVNAATLAAEAGRITGVIGPNGAGKTTCFNVVTGLQPATSGEVYFKDQLITRAPVHRRAKMGIGRTFQRLEAFGSLSVRDNVLASRNIFRGPASWLRPREDDSVDRLIELVGIGAYADSRADTVPTGVARLVELARILAIEPDLMLLDEPSSGLDPGETEQLGRLLRTLVDDGRAVLMVEHDMDLVMSVCDWIYVLEFGSVIAEGTPADIRASRIVQTAYLGGPDEAVPVKGRT
jgi:branched-chain amino acid transport system ATP-binding protein